MTFSFNKRLSLLALAFALAQGVLHHSLQSAALNTPFADDVKAHTPSAARSVLSAALYPLDLLKKASLCVIKSPWIFLTATSALLSQASAGASNRPAVLGTFSLSDQWDTEICVGRALNATHKKHFLQQKQLCRSGMLETLCDLDTCAPTIIEARIAEQVKKGIHRCVKNICHKTGVPYTKHFLYTAPILHAHNNTARQQIDQKILKAEKCFESFCQTYAHHTCPQKTSWWESIAGRSLCNTHLCPGQFVSKKPQEIFCFVSQSPNALGYRRIQECQDAQDF